MATPPGSDLIQALADFAPEGETCGVGLALEDGSGRFLFCVAGFRYRCPPGQRYFMGIGGHREQGESWVDCARREAREEIGAELAVMDAGRTLLVTAGGLVEEVRLRDDAPRPAALYEMPPIEGAPEAPRPYRLVILRASLATPVEELQLREEEVAAVLAVTKSRLARHLEGPRSLGRLLAEGEAELLAERVPIDRETALVPIGTAWALSTIAKRAPDVFG